jgi:hypothetical protein
MNGVIIIYINKKHKNVLIRIELTAYNFINTINNPLQKWGLSDYLKYVIVEKNGFYVTNCTLLESIGTIYNSNGFSKILES